MRPSTLLVTAAMVGLVATACGSDLATDGGTATEEPDAGAAGGYGAGEEAADDAADDEGAAASAGAGGSFTLDGTTYEVTEVLDCTVDDPIAPNDRQFIGESADGSVEMSVAYFEDESLSGLTGLDVTVQGPDGDQDWSSSVVGAERAFTIEQRPDGASGTAEVGRIGPGDEPSPVVAEWSFTC